MATFSIKGKPYVPSVTAYAARIKAPLHRYSTYDIKTKEPVQMDTRGRKLTEARSIAGQNHKNLTKGNKALNDVWNIPKHILDEAGISRSDIAEMAQKIREASRELSHTYTMCPTCKKALTGRKFRKDAKKTYNHICQICGSMEQLRNWGDKPVFRTTRQKLSLKEAKAKLRETHLELFL